jgi:predicted outer membrane repeat protein
MLTLLAGVGVAKADVVISEFRTRGPAGGSDEFVELYNNSDNPVDISGWKINASNSSGTAGTRVTINAGTTIPARGHFLATGPAYGGTVTGNQTYGTGITDDGGIALAMPDDTIVDRVGMSTGSVYKEGSILTPLTTNTDQSYERKGGGGLGSTQDTNNNLKDFQPRSPLMPPNPQNLTSAVTPPSTVLQVSDCADTGGPNQLRQVILDAQAAGGANIIFTCGPNIVLDASRGPLPSINSNVFIDGANNMEISGNNLTRIFLVSGYGTLVLKNISITHGYTNDTVEGGAALNYGILSISNSHFLFNSTPLDHSASAIYSQTVLIINQSEFANNTGGGGAVKPDGTRTITTISGCSFHDNQSASSGGGGYGSAMQILNGASAQVDNTTFSNNSAPFGGAIYVGAGSMLAINGATFSGNTPGTTNGTGTGGGIWVDGTTNIVNCTFRANQAVRGGGINVGSGGSLTVDTTTFTSNTATGSFGTDYEVGGGISNSGTTNLVNVVLTQNSAAYGGGLYTDGGSLTLNSVTLGANSAPTRSSYPPQLAGGLGGGIYSSAPLALSNCTLSGNSADVTGGGISNAGTATLTNVTFSGNSAANGGSIRNVSSATLTNTILVKGANGGNCSGTISGSVNLADDGTCGFGAVNNILLGPLANNGGFTQTHVPQAGSAAINGGTPSGAPPRDQRGFTRDAAPDVGAVEVGGTLLPAPASVASVKTHGTTDFSISLPLTGNGAVECRTGGAGGNHRIVLNFASPVTLSGASVTKGIGSVSSIDVNGSQVTVDLTGVANAQYIFLTLFDVSDETNSNDITVPMGVLLGDVNGSRRTDAGDVTAVRNHTISIPTDEATARFDVNVSGRIDAGDVTATRNATVTVLPP